MAYPPQLPPPTRTDSTISAVNHAQDHNLIASALADFLEELGAGPAGEYANLTERLLGISAAQDSEAIRAFLEHARTASAAAVAASASATSASASAELAAAIAIGDYDAALAVLIGNLATATGKAVDDRYRHAINVRSYGAKGDGITDDTAAIQAAITASLATGVPVYLPFGAYLVTSTLNVDVYSSRGSSTFRMFGDGAGSGPNPMTVIHYNGAGVCLDLALVDYRMEGLDLEGIGFRQVGAYHSGTGVRVRKVTNGENYNRHIRFTDVIFAELDTCVEFRGENLGNILDNFNFFGPTHFDHINAYDVVTGIRLNYAVLNLWTVKRSLFHGTSDYAIDALLGAPIVKFEDVHFEGCEPAALRTGPNHTGVTFDGVSAENTGNASGMGLIDPRPGESSALRLYVSNWNYPPVFMPPELRLPKDTQLWASDHVYAAGEGLRIHTPETVTPVVSAGEPYTYVLTEPRPGALYPGEPIYRSPWGAKAGAGGISPASSGLPLPLRDHFVGMAPASVTDAEEAFTAPADGLLYFSWLALAGTSGPNELGFEFATITIDGDNVPIPTGYRYLTHAGTHTLIVPIAAGQVLTKTLLNQYARDWTGPALITFAEDPVPATQLSPPQRRRRLKRITIANGATAELAEEGAYNVPSATKVTLIVNGGALGVYTFVTRTGGLNENRVTADVVKTLAAGVATSAPPFPAHVYLYGVAIANTTGAAITVDAEVEYLS